MAFNADNSGTTFSRIESDQSFNPPGSITVFAKLEKETITNGGRAVTNVGSGNQEGFQLLNGNNINYLRFSVSIGGSSHTAGPTGSVMDAGWNNVIGEYIAGATDVVSVFKTSATTADASINGTWGTYDDSVSNLAIGNVPAGGDSLGWDKGIAEVAIWHRTLTDDEKASLLFDDFSPAFFPGDLVFYAPLISDNPNWIDIYGSPLTEYGSGLKMDHPRVVYLDDDNFIPYNFVSGGVSVNLTGQSSTGQLGAVSVTGGASLVPTANSITGNIGSISVLTGAIVNITGNQSVSSLGDITVNVEGGVSVTPSGVNAAGTIGTLTATGASVVTLTGVSSTGQLGNVTVNVVGNVTVNADGVFATGIIGAVTVTGGAIVNTSGVISAGQLGNLSITGGSSVTVTGVNATGTVGTYMVNTGASVTPTGNQTAGQVGVVTVELSSNTGRLTASLTIVSALDGDIIAGPSFEGSITIN